jgi:hypothetical protein
MSNCLKQANGRGQDKKMRIGWIGEAAMVVLAMALPWASAQSASVAESGPRVHISSAVIVSSGSLLPSGGLLAQGQVLREIDDPHNGDRWLLTLDPNHPGGPGQLRLVAAAHGSSAERREPRPGELLQGEPLQAGPASEPAPPVIRSGDRVIVEQHTPVVDARLEAVAMSPAQVGSAFNARLTMSGGMVRVVAVAPGRAVIEEEKGR